jgi:hypothetical protein
VGEPHAAFLKESRTFGRLLNRAAGDPDAQSGVLLVQATAKSFVLARCSKLREKNT